jgi:hypothetical protein
VEVAEESERTRKPRWDVASTRSSLASRVTASRTTLRLTPCCSTISLREKGKTAAVDRTGCRIASRCRRPLRESVVVVHGPYAE